LCGREQRAAKMEIFQEKEINKIIGYVGERVGKKERARGEGSAK
jgi:hypothetical protein